MECVYTMDSKRYALFHELINVFDDGCDITAEYDALPHDYNGIIMFQAESQIIKIIGNHDGITSSEIAHMLNKTVSACSQLVKKLRNKEWVYQTRNDTNNREYNLHLTEEGKIFYQKHHEFEEKCYRRTYNALSEFSEKDLRTYIEIQKKMNITFRMDVEESRLEVQDES